MGKLVKWLALILLGVLLIVAIGAGILLLLLDEDRIKQELTKAAHQSTGGTLAIDGALGLSLFPQLGVSVEQLHFTPRDQTEPLAAIGTLQLGVDFMPLFSGQINVGEITLEGLRLNLVREANGAGNWENLTAGEEKATPATAVKPDTPVNTRDTGAMTLAISRLHIADTEINYTDRKTGANYQLGEFNLDSQGVNLSGGSFPASITFSVHSGAPKLTMKFDLDTQLSGDLQAQILELQSTNATIVTSGEPTNNVPLTMHLATNARIDLQKGTASLQNLKLGVEQLKLSGKIDMSGLQGQPNLKANLQSEPFNPRALASSLQQPVPEFTNDKALTELRFASDIDYSDNSARLNNLNVLLDKTQINGSIALTDIDKQALQVKLKIDQLDLDDYRVVVVDDNTVSASKPTSKGKAVTPLPILPIETIKKLNLDATINLGKLAAEGVELTDIALKAKANNGVVNLSQLTAELYQGRTSFAAAIDVRPQQPDWTFNGSITKVQIAPLLKATSEIDWIEGSLDFNGKLSAQGNQLDTLKKTVKGPAKFSLSKGVLRDMSLDKTVCQAIALVNGKQLTKTFAKDTPLNNIEGSLEFGNGRLTNKAFTAGLSNTSVKGSGYIGLLDDAIDYRLGVRVIGELEEVDPACEVNKRYKDIYWPLRCKGSLDNKPAKLCSIDSDGIEEVVKKMAGKELETRAKDAINDALQRFLR
jgi:AsmA protein